MELEPRFKVGDIVYYYRNDALWDTDACCKPVLCKTGIEDAYEKEHPKYGSYVCYHIWGGASVVESNLFKTEWEARAWVNKEADEGSSAG